MSGAETRDANEIMESWNPPPVDSGYERTVGVEVPDGDTRATAAFGSVPPATDEYDDMDFAALKAEIDERNEDRPDDDQISKGGSADDLRARLREDDAEGE